MADVQLENGFTRIANELLEEITKREFSKRQRKILDFIIRYSFGFHQKAALIPKLSYFTLCGINKVDVKKELALLECENIIFWEKEYNIFEINKNYQEWGINISKNFDKEKEEELVKYLLKQISKKQNTNSEVSKILTQGLVKYLLVDSGKADSESDLSSPKDNERYINITTTTTGEDKKIFFEGNKTVKEKKEIRQPYGFYQKVFLTEQEYRDLEVFAQSSELVSQVIEELDSNIAEGKVNALNEENHWPKLRKYIQYKRKRPDKFQSKKYREKERIAENETSKSGWTLDPDA